MNEVFKNAGLQQGDNHKHVIEYPTLKPQGDHGAKTRQHGGQTGPGQQGTKIRRADWNGAPAPQMMG